MAFSSERLNFVLLQREDATLYSSLMMDQEVMQYITGAALDQKKALERFQNVLRTNNQPNDFGTYGAFIKQDHQFVGIAKFVPSDEQVQRVEIGYALLKNYWGLGYATEISRSLISFAQQIDEVECLEALVSPKNAASKRILEKCQFIFFGKTISYDQDTEIYRRNL